MYFPTTRPTFLGAAYEPDGSAHLSVIGAPFDHGLSVERSISLAPQVIRQQSLMLENGPYGIYPWFYRLDQHCRLIDCGDLHFSPEQPVSEILDALTEKVHVILERGTSLLMLGGAHTVSLGAIRACAKRWGKLALVVFDAHEDIVDRAGTQPHAGSWASDAVREGLVAPEHSVQIYIRNCMHEPHASPLGYRVIWANEAMELSSGELAALVRKRVGTLPVYVSFDIDAFDASHVPGTGNPSFGGPNPSDVLRLLYALRGMQIVAADLVEVSPDLDVCDMTALLGAQVAANLLYLMAAANG